MSSNDLTAPARIRAAALKLFGEQGFRATTVRQIAAEAGVSTGLVIHHFGSKDGLREAVDEWFIEFLGSQRELMFASRSLRRIANYLTDHPEIRPIMTYLVAALREGGQVADHVYDVLVKVTLDTQRAAVASGVMREVPDPEGLAALMVAYSCGVMLFDTQLGRHLGGTDLLSAPAYERYSAISLDLFSHALFTTDAFAETS